MAQKGKPPGKPMPQMASVDQLRRWFVKASIRITEAILIDATKKDAWLVYNAEIKPVLGWSTKRDGEHVGHAKQLLAMYYRHIAEFPADKQPTHEHWHVWLNVMKQPNGKWAASFSWIDE